MPIFAYEAINAKGQKENGELEAANRNQAILDIRNAGLKPTKVTQRAETAAAKQAAKADTGGGAAAAPGKRKRGRVSVQQVTDFTAQFAVLIDAGLPVVRSLKVLAKQQKAGGFKTVLEDVAESVEQGSSLSEAFAMHPKAFDRLYTNMIKAGEAGGILDTILQRLADFMEKAARLKKKVIGAMIYPIIVMSVAVMILTGIMIFVVPAFEKMFKEQGFTLPFATAMLVMFSRAIVNPFIGGIGIILIIAASLAFGAWSRTTAGTRIVDSLKLKVPIFGNIIQKAVTARFTRTLGTLVQAGVPILEALTICKNAIGNVVLGAAIEKVAASIKEGETIAGPLSETGMFDDLVVNMIDVGEETGELDKMLIKVADTFDVYVDIAVESLVSILEPVLIVFMGGAIGFIVIALFLPLVGLIENIK